MVRAPSSFSRNFICSWPRIQSDSFRENSETVVVQSSRWTAGRWALFKDCMSIFLLFFGNQWHPRWWPLHPDSEADGPSITLRMGCEKLKLAAVDKQTELERQLLLFQGVHTNRDEICFTAATLFHQHV